MHIGFRRKEKKAAVVTHTESCAMKSTDWKIFTEAQAGARWNRSTIEHLFTFNKSIIQHIIYIEKTETHVGFLDLEKAYHQAWKNAIF